MDEATEEARYEVLRERYWELAGIEGIGLGEFVENELLGATRADVERLRRLVDDVEDTALKNIAVKAGEEGGVYEALADERTAEIAEERARLFARLDQALADAR
jgi:hypothetical protein